MGPYGFGAVPGGSTSLAASKQQSEIDGQLAGAGYRVRLSELPRVAQRLERLENVIGNAPSGVSQLASDAVVHSNPSDLASWVDSLLYELSPLAPGSESCSTTSQPLPPPPLYSDPYYSGCSSSLNQTAIDRETWTDQIVTQQQSQLPLTAVADVEEDSGIRLVHMLMTCAEAVQRGQLALAGSLIGEMKALLLTRVNADCGIGKVAGYFIDALSRRLYEPHQGGAYFTGVGFEHEILYHHFYEGCPYLKFAHFTANQAILEAFEGYDCVHVIDFSLMHGLQWPPLIQALALRPGGPPLLRLTGVGPPSPDGRDSLREVGLKLADLARSVNVRFDFRGIAAIRLEDVKPWMLQVNPKDAVAVNSIMQLHRLLYPSADGGSCLDSILKWIHNLNPKIVTVIEQDANHNSPKFLDRFTEALYYYSTMFDSLEACQLQPEKALAEMYIQREICNIMCCEGSARVERHEPLSKWRARLGRAGFKPLHLGSNAFKQASMLLTLFSAEGYCVEETEGCLTLGWHSRPLIAASAWQAEPHTITASNPNVV
ncbi:Protein SLENDER RICE1-LIKE 1 [Ancistrocladus abbreviatus]